MDTVKNWYLLDSEQEYDRAVTRYEQLKTARKGRRA